MRKVLPKAVLINPSIVIMAEEEAAITNTIKKARMVLRKVSASPMTKTAKIESL